LILGNPDDNQFNAEFSKILLKLEVPVDE